MPDFVYKGYDFSGAPTSGTVEAKSLDAAVKKLQSNQITPTQIDEIKVGEELPKFSLETLLTPKVTTKDLLTFCRQMFAFTKAGIPMDQALNNLSAQNHNKTLGQTIAKIRESVAGGKDLSTSMSAYENIFPNVVISLVRIGEKSGEIEAAFTNIINYLSYIEKSSKQIKSTLRYPLIVIFLALGAFAFFSIVVIPKFKDLLEQFGVELPVFTRGMIAISEFMSQYWIPLFGGIGLVFAGIYYLLGTPKGKSFWHEKQLKIPIFGSIIQQILLARFARIFSITMKAGLSVIDSLTLIAESLGNIHVKMYIYQMLEGIERGESITSTINKIPIFPTMMRQMISIGEETGDMERMLNEVAEYYEGEVDYHTSKLKDYIEPIVMVILGGLVLMMALGIFVPMWDLASGARGG